MISTILGAVYADEKETIGDKNLMQVLVSYFLSVA